MSFKIERRPLVDMFVPTTATGCASPTPLIIEVEKDFTTYGEEVTVRRRQGDREALVRASYQQGWRADTVITNALILDPLLVVNSYVGIKDVRSPPIGNSGNPTSSRRHPGDRVPHRGDRGRVQDSHRRLLRHAYHFICPQQIEEALIPGITLDARRRTGRRPAPCHHLPRPPLAISRISMPPMPSRSTRLFRQGHASRPAALEEMVKAAPRLKLHEDWGPRRRLDCDCSLPTNYDCR